MNKLFLLLLIPILAFGQATTGFHRVNQLLARGTSGVTAQIVPNGSIYVTNTATGATATIYSDPGLSIQITSGLVTSDKNGNYDYYIPLNYCVNETVSAPGQGSYTTKNICINGGEGSGTVGSGTAGQVPYYAANGTTVQPTSSLPNGITATTQTTGDNTTKVATDAFVLATVPVVNFASPPVLGSTTPNVVNGTNGNFSGTVAAGAAVSVGTPITGQTGGNMAVKDSPIDEVQYIGPALGAKPGAVGVCSDSNDGLSPGSCKNSIYAAYRYLQQSYVTGTITPGSGGTIYVMDGGTCGGPSNAVWIMGPFDPWAVANSSAYAAGTLPSGWLKSIPIAFKAYANGHSIGGISSGSSVACDGTNTEFWISGTFNPVIIDGLIVEASASPMLIGVGSDGSTTSAPTSGVRITNTLVRVAHGAPNTAGPAIKIGSFSGNLYFEHNTIQGNTTAGHSTTGADAAQAVVINPTTLYMAPNIVFRDTLLSNGNIKVYGTEASSCSMFEAGSGSLVVDGLTQQLNVDGKGAVWVPSQSCDMLLLSNISTQSFDGTITAAPAVQIDAADLPPNIVVSNPKGNPYNTAQAANVIAPLGTTILNQPQTNGAQIDIWGSRALSLASGGVVGFINAGGTARDTGISRLNPGVIGVGNGIPGDFSGALVTGVLGLGTGNVGLGLGLTNTKGVTWLNAEGSAALASLLIPFQNTAFICAAAGTSGCGAGFEANGIVSGAVSLQAGGVASLNGYWVDSTNVISSTGAVTGTTLSTATARKGTFVCTAGGTIAISNTNEAATSDVIISLGTAGGIISTPPAMNTVTAATGFTVLCGAADTSTYNYTILN